MDAITLADFAAWYGSNTTYVKQTNILDTDDLLIETRLSRCNDDQHNDDDEDSDVYKSSK